MLKLLSFILFLSAFSNATAKEVNHLPELGVGFTNNANYESSDKDKDFYGKLGYTALIEDDDYSLSLSTGYRDYKEQSANDMLSWGASMALNFAKTDKSKKSFTFGASGQHFVKTSSAITDESFDSISGIVNYSSTTIVSESYSFTLSPSYTFTKYLAETKRNDHNIGFTALYENKLSETHTLSPFAETSFLKSSDTDYSKFDIGLGTSWNWILSDDYELETTASLGRSIYFNRTISTQTLVSRKRRALLLAGTQKEQHTSFYLGTSLTRVFDSFDLKLDLHRIKNSTNSGSEDFTEWGADISLLFYL